MIKLTMRQAQDEIEHSRLYTDGGKHSVRPNQCRDSIPRFIEPTNQVTRDKTNCIDKFSTKKLILCSLIIINIQEFFSVKYLFYKILGFSSAALVVIGNRKIRNK